MGEKQYALSMGLHVFYFTFRPYRIRRTHIKKVIRYYIRFGFIERELQWIPIGSLCLRHCTSCKCEQYNTYVDRLSNMCSYSGGNRMSRFYYESIEALIQFGCNVLTCNQSQINFFCVYATHIMLDRLL